MGSVCASNFSTNDVNRTALYCDNLKSTDFKSDAVLPIILSQTQHECCQNPFCVFAGIFKSEALRANPCTLEILCLLFNRDVEDFDC